MKSSVLIILAALLATAILAPSVIILTGIGEKSAITVDFGEEEKKEEKKEAKEKDFFLDSNFSSLTHLKKETQRISNYYIKSSYNTSLAIFLPPPEHSI